MIIKKQRGGKFFPAVEAVNISKKMWPMKERSQKLDKKEAYCRCRGEKFFPLPSYDPQMKIKLTETELQKKRKNKCI